MNALRTCVSPNQCGGVKIKIPLNDLNTLGLYTPY